MTTKDKIKAFIEENAKYKVGQTVFFRSSGKPYYAKVTSVHIDCSEGDFAYRGGLYDSYIGLESKLYGSIEELRNAVVKELQADADRWRNMYKVDAYDTND